jgi:hypothetical protein
MKYKRFGSRISKLSGGLVAGILAPGAAFACACGCGVYDVGTSSMLPEGAGGTAFFSYTFQDQDKNWSGNSSAPSANNSDKKIETTTYAPGAQYFFNRDWGAQIQIPVVHRRFISSDNTGPITWTGLGDIQLRCIYTGLADDLSTGLSLGVKLPTGSYDHKDAAGSIDRDVQIGSGSTDLLLGAFHRGDIAGSCNWNWFAQAQLDVPVLTQGDFRPGLEADAAGGIYYQGFSLGRVDITPVGQVIGVWRGRDNGAAAASEDSGYQRVLLSPGIEFRLDNVKLYGDVEFPVYQNVKGNQLVSPALFKVALSYIF